MPISKLVFGLWNKATIQDAALAEKLRGFTISWIRYGYHGPIFESSSIDQILAQAAEAGYQFCFVQTRGNVILEPWKAPHWNCKDFHGELADWIQTKDFFISGDLLTTPSDCQRFDSHSFVVNLDYYKEFGRPTFETGALESLPTARSPGTELIQAGIRHGKPILQLPEAVLSRILSLHSGRPDQNSSFAGFLNDNISKYNRTAINGQLLPSQKRFLDAVQRHTANAQQGVFLWNVESYRDVAELPLGFQSPVTTLYSVAAGFKPNMVLHTHGFSPQTRVAYFDYSQQALEFKKLLHQEWDGEDYPRFLHFVFRKLPSSSTFYHLWNDMSPEDLTSRDIQTMWENETRQWGGEERFKDHWRQYRRLKHDYVHCNILTQPEKLFNHIERQPNAIIWWSNAFFTVHSNWFYTVEERKRIYGGWVRGLADRNPDLYLYGFDFQNLGVNGLRAGEHAERYFRQGQNYLIPEKFHRVQIRS